MLDAAIIDEARDWRNKLKDVLDTIREAEIYAASTFSLRLHNLFRYAVFLMTSREEDVFNMVRVKKRDGKIQDYVQSKIEASVKKAGATAEQAAEVVKAVAKKIANKAEVTSAELSRHVVEALRKINKKAADAYVAYRDKKLKEKAAKK